MIGTSLLFMTVRPEARLTDRNSTTSTIRLSERTEFIFMVVAVHLAERCMMIALLWHEMRPTCRLNNNHSTSDPAVVYVGIGILYHYSPTRHQGSSVISHIPVSKMESLHSNSMPFGTYNEGTNI